MTNYRQAITRAFHSATDALKSKIVRTKTIEAELLAITAIAANIVQKSSVLSLAGLKAVTVLIDHGRTATTAFVGKGTQYIVEASQKASGDDAWIPLATFEAEIATAVETTADGAEAAGQTVIECNDQVPSIDDFVFWENATLALSEWGRVVARNAGVGVETFTLEDGLTNAQAVAKKIYNKAHRWSWVFEVGSLTRMRVVVNNAAPTTSVAIKARVACITES